MQRVQWIFTAGVAIAVLCDLLITGSLCYYLHSVSDFSFLRNVIWLLKTIAREVPRGFKRVRTQAVWRDARYE